MKKYPRRNLIMVLHFCSLPFAFAQAQNFIDETDLGLSDTIISDVIEGVKFSAPAKMMITEHYATMGSWPTTNREIGLPDPMAGGVVAAVKVKAGGSYIIHYTPKVKDYTFEFKATVHATGSSIEWHCVGGTLPEIYWPESCKINGNDIAYNVDAGIAFATVAKMAIYEYYATEGQWPQSNADIGLPDPYANTTVENVRIKPNGAFEILYNKRVNNYTLEFQASANDVGNPSFRWSCTGGTLPDMYRPESCIAKEK